MCFAAGKWRPCLGGILSTAHCVAGRLTDFVRVRTLWRSVASSTPPDGAAVSRGQDGPFCDKHGSSPVIPHICHHLHPSAILKNKHLLSTALATPLHTISLKGFKLNVNHIADLTAATWFALTRSNLSKTGLSSTMVAKLAAAQRPLLQQLNVSNNKLGTAAVRALISHHLPACLKGTEPLCQQPGCSLHFRAYTRQLDNPRAWTLGTALAWALIPCHGQVSLKALTVQGNFWPEGRCAAPPKQVALAADSAQLLHTAVPCRSANGF